MAERLSQDEISELLKSHPDLLVIRDSADPYLWKRAGFRVGPGWKQLINSLLLSIQRYIDFANSYTDNCVSQIKIKFIVEKAGVLRVYYDGNSDKCIDAMIDVTSEISKTICEISGAPGRQYAKDGWFKTLSPEIATMLEYELDQRLSDSESGAGIDAGAAGG